MPSERTRLIAWAVVMIAMIYAAAFALTFVM